MTVRFASFNVENLFARPRAFNQTTWAQGEPILAAFAEFNALAEQAVYSGADRNRMIRLLTELDVYHDVGGIIRRNRVATRAGRGFVQTGGPSMSSTRARGSRSSRPGGTAGSAGSSSRPSRSTR